MSVESIDWGDEEDPFSYAAYERRYATRAGRRENRHHKLVQHVGEALTCPACLRLRFSPIHWVVRALGLCPGKDFQY